MVEKYANAFATPVVLTADLSVGGVTVDANSVAPVALQGGEFRISIQLDPAHPDNTELLLVTAGQSTTTWTVTRGVEGTTAVAHASGSTVAHVMTAASLLNLPEVADMRSGFATAKARVDATGVAVYLVADSATDNSTALRAAADALPINGGTIYMHCPGTGETIDFASEVIFSKAGSRLVAVGPAGTIFRAASGFTGASLFTFQRASSPSNGNPGPTISGFQVDMNGQAAHGITIVKGYDLVSLADVEIYGVADAYSGWRIIPDAGVSNKVSQGILAQNCHAMHKNDTATAPTWFVQGLQESQFVNCKGWGGPSSAATAPGWEFRDCRGVQMRGGAAAASAVAGIVVSGVDTGSIGVLLDAVTFEAVALAVSAVGTAGALITYLSIRDPRFEPTVTNGVTLSYAAGSDIESHDQTVTIDANCSQTHIWTSDRRTITDAGVDTSIVEWANSNTHGVNIYPLAQPCNQVYPATPTLAVDARRYSTYEMLLTENLSISNPTNPVVGAKITFILWQYSTGGYTVAFDTLYRVNWTPDTTAGKVNSITFQFMGLEGIWAQVASATGC